MEVFQYHVLSSTVIIGRSDWVIMQAFADISDSLRLDRYMHPHFRYYLREVRVVAYSQVCR